MSAPIYDWSGKLLWGSEWRVELYGGAATDSLAPAVRNETTDQRVVIPLLAPGCFKDPDGYATRIPAVQAGGYAWLQAQVWDVGLGGTYEKAAARRQGGYGQSDLLYRQGGSTQLLANMPQRTILGG